MHPLIREAESAQLRTDIPYFRVGDTLKVNVRIIEGEKERIQAFEGLVIGKKGSGIRETFTVRRISFNVGIERIFPLHSPRIESIKVIRRAKVRRAKLYYLRELRGKKARLVERRVSPEKLGREALRGQSNLLTLVAERTARAQAIEVEQARANAEAEAKALAAAPVASSEAVEPEGTSE